MGVRPSPRGMRLEDDDKMTITTLWAGMEWLDKAALWLPCGYVHFRHGSEDFGGLCLANRCSGWSCTS